MCANKQDVENAMSANDLIDYLDLDSYKCNHLCIECTVKGKEGSVPNKDFMEGMQWLLHTASVQYTSLQERVKRDTQLEKEKQEKKMEERRLRVEKLKAERQEENKRLAAEQEKEEQASPSSPSLSSANKSPTPGSPESLYAVPDENEPKVNESCVVEAAREQQQEGLQEQQIVLPGVISN